MVAAGAAASAEAYTPLQAGMSHLWSRVLKTGRVGLDDDFFLLGGNSLLAAEMLARARVMFGIGANYVRPLTRRLLRDPTLRGFSHATQDARAGRLTATARITGRTSPARPNWSIRSAGTRARRRTGGGRVRSSSPGRPASSAFTCCVSC